MTFTIENVDWQSGKNRLTALRQQVFVLEWHLPDHIEFDERDKDAIHVLVYDKESTPIATARLTADGEIGRIAVKKYYRSPTLYRALFNTLVTAGKCIKVPYIKVLCRLDSVEKHRLMGYEPDGRVFMEAGIPRQRMRCPIQQFCQPDVRDLH
ncbi:GNAT family N-acetyltransferase [Aestuariibacter sp. A3R04]|uniref:GNAT family N-acetyltransferase n=1 Tax=Aestuariibacter sp. A3R04 TaxID=2841571 RepID=UPI001C0A07BF|nr:GNAT family N-acetyltransferase [Aestuariibacter sp. A3R04]MBU3023093.1 GNAT family N-acetyltransferase [Aestuariibacter sp. A3R04]